MRIDAVFKRNADWIGHILSRNCLLHEEEDLEGEIIIFWVHEGRR